MQHLDLVQSDAQPTVQWSPAQKQFDLGQRLIILLMGLSAPSIEYKTCSVQVAYHLIGLEFENLSRIQLSSLEGTFMIITVTSTVLH